MSLKKVVECIRRNNNFLITAHTSPEGDALGSELAFYRLLKSLGKTARIINEDSSPYEYSFLPGIDKIQKFSNNLKNLRFGCLVVLDCSDLARCGRVYKINQRKFPILNIDHHISNEKFGTMNWVDPDASSCAEMIYKLYKKLRLPLNRNTALFLYTGILTDTGSFRYTNTTSFTHKIVSQLLRYRLDVSRLYKHIYGNIPYHDMQLLTRVLSSMRSEALGRIVWFQMRRSRLRKRKINFDLAENILSFGRAIKDVEVAVLFKENFGVRDEVRVNFRSEGKVDVNKIAHFFGGGGHRTASGCTIQGKIEQVRRKVLAKVREALAKSR